MFQRELVMVRKDSESQAKKKALEEGNLIESEFEFVFPFRLQPGSHLDLDIELFSEVHLLYKLSKFESNLY